MASVVSVVDPSRSAGRATRRAATVATETPDEYRYFPGRPFTRSNPGCISWVNLPQVELWTACLQSAKLSVGTCDNVLYELYEHRRPRHSHLVQKAWSQPLSKNDVLFRSVEPGNGDDEDSEMNAWVRGATPYAYAEGYRLAARLVADSVIRNRWDTDFLVYPIAFLYRHNVELQLKMLIQDGAFITGQTLPETDRKLLKSSHRLDQLWGIFEPILRKLGTQFGITSDDIQAIDSYIRQIHTIDELSFSFRI